MGNLAIKNKVLRCEKCFMLKKITIEPDYPQTTVCTECNCGCKNQSILSFTNELKKEEQFKIKCSFCGKEQKHHSYCTGCRRTYCNNCIKLHDTTQATRTPHYIIDSFKYDFYCSKHQEELVNAYCMNCCLNICQNCINEKSHKSHRFVKYSKIIMKDKEKDLLNKNLKDNMDKIDANVKRCNKILELQNNEDKKKEIRDVCNITVRDNKSILALIQYFFKMYNEAKHKNYTIIFNVTENIKFNPQPVPPDDDSSVEQKTSELLEYLKREFVIFKRFNSNKARSNTTVNNAQMHFLKKKKNKDESKEENKNIDGINNEKNDEETNKSGRNYTVTTKTPMGSNSKSNMFSLFGVEKQKENNTNLNENININLQKENNNNNQIISNSKEDKNDNDNINIIKEDKMEEEEDLKINNNENNKDDNIVNINEIINKKDEHAA